MARPAYGVNGCGRPSTGGTRPAQMGRVTGGPASQPTRGAGMTTLTFTTLTFPEINQALICKSMSLAFLQSEHDKSFYLRWSPSTSKPERRAGEALHRPMGRLAGGGAIAGRRVGASTTLATRVGDNSSAGVAGGAPAMRVAAVVELGLTPNVHGRDDAQRRCRLRHRDGQSREHEHSQLVHHGCSSELERSSTGSGKRAAEDWDRWGRGVEGAAARSAPPQ